MPLTKELRKVKGKFISEYGKKKGTSFFYGWERKHYPVMFKRVERRKQ